MSGETSPSLAKGHKFEELLRAYFLHVGAFVVRGVPLQNMGDDLTDLDIWVYEAPFGGSRRRQVVDAKFKSKPKAIERLLWTRGLIDLLELDGAWVATTDSRKAVKDVATKIGLGLIDGKDLQTISLKIQDIFTVRMPEEDLIARINVVDRNFRDKRAIQTYRDTKFALIDEFGSRTLVRGLENFAFAASKATEAHPSSKTAEVFVRIAYFAAAVAAVGLDSVVADVHLRTNDDRRKAIINAVRYGHPDENSGLERMRLALALIRRYGSSENAAQSVESALRRELKNIPAEIIADFAINLDNQSKIFALAKKFEHTTFSWELLSFDDLALDEKTFLGTLLDYSGVKRPAFAEAWKGRASRDLLAYSG